MAKTGCQSLFRTTLCGPMGTSIFAGKLTLIAVQARYGRTDCLSIAIAPKTDALSMLRPDAMFNVLLEQKGGISADGS